MNERDSCGSTFSPYPLPPISEIWGCMQFKVVYLFIFLIFWLLKSFFLHFIIVLCCNNKKISTLLMKAFKLEKKYYFFFYFVWEKKNFKKTFFYSFERVALLIYLFFFLKKTSLWIVWLQSLRKGLNLEIYAVFKRILKESFKNNNKKI